MAIIVTVTTAQKNCTPSPGVTDPMIPMRTSAVSTAVMNTSIIDHRPMKSMMRKMRVRSTSRCGLPRHVVNSR